MAGVPNQGSMDPLGSMTITAVSTTEIELNKKSELMLMRRATASV